MDDPFGGVISIEGRVDMIHLTAGPHQIEYREGTRIAAKATIFLTDDTHGTWRLELTPVTAPWFPATLGYTPGSWKDGGTFHT